MTANHSVKEITAMRREIKIKIYFKYVNRGILTPKMDQN